MRGSDSPVFSLPEQFFRAAAAHPGRTAVSTGDDEVTYGWLAGTALRVAAGLRDKGVVRGDTVGVCLPRDQRLVPCLLGVLAAGAAYVPVDHRHVSRRTDRALADAGARFVVDTTTWDPLVAADPLPAPLGVGPDDLAYVLFTSGSTGTPKGVAVEHGALAAMLGWAQEAFDVDEARTSSAVASIGFDFSVLELLLPLSRGGTVLLAEDLLALAEHPRFAELTLLHAVPAAAALLLDAPLPSSVRTVAFGGERLSRALADRAYANPGVTRVVNIYGPTENTVVATAAEVPAGGREQPVIGTAVGGTRTHVVGADGRPADEGELWLTGSQLARGYVGLPDVTAAAFVELDGERAYRTGDQVRLVDGVLHYVGRDDDQVKVRGVRIELGEVEAALSELAGARRVAAAVVGDRLVGYVDGDLDTGAARGALRDLLPEFLVPDQLVTTELVLGSTGKIDRSALPQPSERRADAGGPPRGPAEELVAGLVRDLLDLAVLGREAPLDDAGLHSLAAARLVQRLAEQDGRLLPPGSALAGATVADVARALEEAPRAATTPPASARAGEVVPLTDLQQRMWLLRALADDPAVTSVGLHLRLDPAPATGLLRAALVRLTEVHPTLRMAVEDGPTGPRGRLLEPGVLLEEGTDLDGLGPVRLDGREPTLRARLVRDGDRADLAIVADHVALDGWGAGVLAADLDRLLCGEDVEAPPVALWQLSDHTAQGAASVTAGQHRTADAEDPLGTGTGARTAPRRGARVARPAGPDVPAATHLAALVTVLHRLTGREDVEVGVVAARRHLPGTARVVAPLLAVLPVSVTVRADDTLAALTRRCAAAIAGALGTLDRERPDAPAPSVVLSVQPDLPVRHRHVAVVGELDTGGSQADLTVLVNRGCDGAELVLEHDPVVDPRTASAFLERYHQVLAAPSTTTVDDAPVLLPAEAAALDAWGTGPACGPTADVVDQVLAQDRARAAVRCGDRSRTYADLVDSALDLAAHLGAHGVRPGHTVGVCLGRDVDLPGRLLGVLLAGAAYVPLDPEHPRARTDFVRSDAGCRVTLVDATTQSADGSADALDVTVVPPRPLGWTAPAADPDSLAYVLHTSGSTGTPKGVAVRRRNLSWFVASMALVPGIGEQDRVLAMTTLTFDISATEIWAPLARGGEVLVVDRETARDAVLLAQRSAGATVVQGTPTTWRMLVDSGWSGGRGVTAVAGGEVLQPDLAAALLHRCDAVWNGYGPTEATVYATMHRVAPSAADALAPVPIGGPVPGALARVVDPTGRRVPPGTVGELWVGGRGVTAGYLGREELTVERFREADGQAWYTTGDLVRWTPEGVLDYLGRGDDQIKVRGHRIEPAEVETVLRSHPTVADVAVGGRGESLVAWWVPVADGDADGAELARYAAAALPGHLVPSRWVRIDALPVGPSGKTDRRALPDPRPEAGSGGPPRGPVEEMVADLWCRVLAVPQVERDASFFALGGHSLAVTRVTAALRDELDLAVPAATLFEHPTLAGFAAQVTAALLQENE